MADEKWSFKSPALLLNGVMYRIRNKGDSLDQAVVKVGEVHGYGRSQMLQLQMDAQLMLKLAGEKGARDAGVI